MKKRVVALMCAMLACLPLLCALAAGTQPPDIYHLVINDHFFDNELTAATMPVRVNGVIYVPYTVFDREAAGADFKISYGQKREGGEYTLTLYSMDAVLIFDLNRGTAADARGNRVDMAAILHNGRPFIPIQAVCNYFNTQAGTVLVQYVYTDTDFGALIRVRNQYPSDAVSLSDFMFRQSALGAMQARRNKYLQSQIPPAASPAPTIAPSASPAPGALPGGEDTPDAQVCLALRADGGTGAQEILSTLSRQRICALFLFSPDELEAQADLVRQVVGAGHTLGLMVPGEDLPSVRQALEKGSALLEEIAWTRTRTVWAPNASGQLRQTLEEEGWHCWYGSVDGTAGTSAAGRVNRIFTAVEQAQGTVRVTMDLSTVSAAALPRLLSRLNAASCAIRPAVETEFS